MDSLDKRPFMVVSPVRPIVPSLLFKVPNKGGTSDYLKVFTSEFETTFQMEGASITLPNDESKRLIAMLGGMVK